MALLPLSYVKGVLEISSHRADAALSALLQGAEKAVKDWCGRDFERLSRTWYPSKDQLGRNDLILPERPVWLVSDVRIDATGYWGTLGTSFAASTALTAGTDYAIRKDAIDGLSSASGMLVRLPSYGSGSPWSTEYGVWPTYDGGVKVVYEGGYYPRGGTHTPTMPADVELAIALLTRELWKATSRGGPVEMESNFAASYTMAKDRMTSMVEPRRLLAKYREA